ncbi:helix-turn-helix domain-containing protein [Dyella silvae]|uniref:helix-turn-helix domain-containing protein n=1 Tax=Dyella silvae TaxID=2994424 RepID=UPI00226442F9|nr:helix-turn-helix domain-containing protein [Dyella silvae]
MNTSHKHTHDAGTTNALGPLMRYWRAQRGKSQFDLSLDTGISQRHISFIESGRSNPSREVLIDIALALEVPLRERNALLQAAGFAPIYTESPLEALEMQGLRNAIERMLRHHDPFPAIVMDRYWNVLMTNEYAPRFFNCFFDTSKRDGPRNMLHLIFDPKGMRPFVSDWERTSRSLIRRVHHEAVGSIIDEKTEELLQSLKAYSDVGDDEKTCASESYTPTTPVIPLSFVREGVVLNYFSLVTTVGTPQTISAQELRIECMFPADESTETKHLQMLGH